MKDVYAPALKSVKIGSHDYDVIVVTDLIKEANMYGYIDHSNNLIKVSCDMPSSNFVNTLVHEVIHGLRSEAGVELDSLENEEKTVTVMANAICRFMQDNPKFFETIFALYDMPIKFLNKKEKAEFYQQFVNSGKLSNKKKATVSRFHKVK